MNLGEYLEGSKTDSNLFWRLSSGEHQNLLDEAFEKIENLEKAHSSERSVHAEVMDAESVNSGEQLKNILFYLKSQLRITKKYGFDFVNNTGTKDIVGITFGTAESLINILKSICEPEP